MTKKYDLIVIGAGSGGLATAQKAATFGASVALIEMQRIGGTCVNVGCVPKKIMWYAGDVADTLRNAHDFGFHAQNSELNFATLVAKREEYITKINQSYLHVLQSKHVDYIEGAAKFIDAHSISVNNITYSGENIVIATGCRPDRPNIKGAELGIDSNGFFDLRILPKKVAIIGAGYIAVELACIFKQLGTDVSVLIRHDKVLRNFDSMLSDALTQSMTQNGIKILPQHQPTEITRNQFGKLTIHCEQQKEMTELDTILFATGRIPHTDTLNLQGIHLQTDKHGFIPTDKWERTNIPHIYAVGDITGKRLLTPVAIAAGRQLATRLFGDNAAAHLDYTNIPSVVFSHPPIGTIGLTEEEAVNKHGREQINIHQSQFNSLVYALNTAKIRSSMKLITLKPHGKIIGCHLIGPGSDEMLQGFAVAIKMGATKHDFDATVAIHPTNAEELVTMKN